MEERKRKSRQDLCEVILLEKSPGGNPMTSPDRSENVKEALRLLTIIRDAPPRETREVKSRLEASAAKAEAMSREVAESRHKTQTLEIMVKIINIFLEQVEKGRLWIWVDVKLVEWLDKQVEMGKYRSRSHAVETIIQSKMREETTRTYEI